MSWGYLKSPFCLFVAHSHAAGDMLAKEGELSVASGSWHLTYCLECDASTKVLMGRKKQSCCMHVYLWTTESICLVTLFSLITYLARY